MFGLGSIKSTVMKRNDKVSVRSLGVDRSGAKLWTRIRDVQTARELFGTQLEKICSKFVRFVNKPSSIKFLSWGRASECSTQTQTSHFANMFIDLKMNMFGNLFVDFKINVHKYTNEPARELVREDVLK